MALIGTLRDTFNDNVVDPTKWPDSYGTHSETGGRARVACDTGFNAYATDEAWTLEASEAKCQLFPPAAGGAATEAWAQLLITSTTAGTDAIIEVNAATGDLGMAVRVGFFDPGFTSLPYDPVAHAWVRIREDSGDVHWETSADGITWTTRRTETSPAWVADVDLQVQLIAHRDGGVDDFAEFDNFNVNAFAALADNFNDNTVDTAKWPDSFGTFSETGGRARVACDTGFSGYASAAIYTLEGSAASTQVFPPAAGGATVDAWAQLLVTSATPGTDAVMKVNAATGDLAMELRTGFFDPGAVLLPYDPAAHAWLRVREAGGDLLWDTSPDGVTWTTRRTAAAPTWVSDTDLQVQLVAHRDSGTDDFAEFDNFNVAPFAQLTDDFTSTTVDTEKWPANYNEGGGGLPDQPDGRARVPCDTGFAAYASAAAYTLDESYAGVHAFPPPSAGMSEAYAQLLILSGVVGTQIVFEIDAATNLLLMTVHVDFTDEGGATLPYDAAEHAWLRVRETAGTLYWETSPDGRDWTARHSDAAPAWVSDNNLQVQLLAHCSPAVTGGGPTGEFAEFDDFNITPELPDGYTVAVDWNSDGDFDDPNDDVTADVLRRGAVTFQYGRDQARQLSPPMVGSLSFGLCNADRIYSPENPDSPIVNDIAPAAPVKVEVVTGDTLYPLIRGRIDDFEVHPDRDNRTADISALDDLSLLRGTTISTELYEAQRTGTLIAVILDAIGWTAPRDLDLGGTFVPWWWAENKDAFTALTELLESEGPPSIAYVAPDGTFVFRDRHHRLLRDASITSQAAFAAREVTCDSPAVTGFSYLPPFEYVHGWRDIINSVVFAVEERRPEAGLSVVWESDDTISLALGQSIQVDVQASDPFRDVQDLRDGTDIVYTGSGVPLILLSRRSGQALTVTITAAGGTLNITHLQVRARPVPVARTVQVAADDSVSIARHSRRSYPETPPWVSANDAVAITQLLLAHYAERRPTVQLRIVSSDMAHWLQILTRTLSDRITIRNGELGLDADFHIERIEQTLTRMMVDEDTCEDPVHYAVFGCERTLGDPTENPFTFDVAGLGFDDGVFDPTAADNPETVFIFDHATQGQFNTGQFGT